MSTPPQVPFVRKLANGNSGPDVVAVKRALSRAGHMQWGEFTPLFGTFAVQAVKSLEKTKGLKQTGVYTFPRHEALRKSHRKGTTNEWAFDALSIKILTGEAVTPEERMRAAIVDAAIYGIVKRDVISYAQIRPMTDMAPPPNVPNTMDCIAAGTLITLQRGDVPIEDVRIGDMVLTRAGYRLVENAWLVRRNAEVMAIPLAEGRTLIGTPEHRVWTDNRGWAELKTLSVGDTLRGCEPVNTAPMIASNMEVSGSTGIPTLRRVTSASTFTGRRATYTASFGQKRMGRSPKDMRSTMWTAIRSTITSRISTAFQGGGTVSYRSNHVRAMLLRAITADWRLNRELVPVGSSGSALTDASRRTIGDWGYTAPRSSAPPAKNRSARIGIGQRPTAPIGVTRPLASARPAGRSDVYDLTVAAEHEFFANGVLVHNCSWFATWTYKCAGAPDPNGLGYNGAGYTGTMINRGQSVSVVQLQPGDLVFYGMRSGVPTHMAVYIGGGYVASHGQESGPSKVPVLYRQVTGCRSYL